MRKRCRREVAEAACAASFALAAEEKKEESMNRLAHSLEQGELRKAAEQEFEMLKSCAIVIALPFLWLLCIVVFVLWFFLVFWLIYKPESVIIR